jgi:hypothetical protein
MGAFHSQVTTGGLAILPRRQERAELPTFSVHENHRGTCLTASLTALGKRGHPPPSLPPVEQTLPAPSTPQNPCLDIWPFLCRISLKRIQAGETWCSLRASNHYSGVAVDPKAQPGTARRKSLPNTDKTQVGETPPPKAKEHRART